ncbi:alpha/beta hydrolase [Kaistella anthropi]|nr:alpha/beta hydrolase [Kaistella anthropi]
MKLTKFLSLLSIFILSFASAQMDDKFYQPSKEMKLFEFTTLENIVFPVEKDTITAYFATPKTGNSKKTVLFFHGAAGNVTTYQYITKPLVESGFQVVMVDLRGYGKSTGKPTHTNVAEDGQKLFDFLVNKPEIKNTKIYIYGASLGSQIATHLARANKEKISGLIIDGGMSSFADIAAVFAPQYKDVIAQMLQNVYSAKEDIKFTEGLPKLFIYSKNDKTVPYSQGEEIFKNASEPKQFLENSADHLQGLKDEPLEILKAINNL